MPIKARINRQKFEIKKHPALKFWISMKGGYLMISNNMNNLILSKMQYNAYPMFIINESIFLKIGNDFEL